MIIAILKIIWNIIYEPPKAIWEWALDDGYNIKKSNWCLEGHSPSDTLSERKWKKYKLNIL